MQIAAQLQPFKPGVIDLPTIGFCLAGYLAILAGINHQLFRHAAPNYAGAAITIFLGKADFQPQLTSRNARRAHAARSTANNKQIEIKPHLHRPISAKRAA